MCLNRTIIGLKVSSWLAENADGGGFESNYYRIERGLLLAAWPYCLKFESNYYRIEREHHKEMDWVNHMRLNRTIIGLKER